ncbi:unnamed protein product [Didymodactylos carnosus]|uniref:Amine oxidase domain-containing protein n=1 Tax=Didymodactylos carnosus TaxID=1234261 RepID=A0A815PZJ2_9BILA|nr:unnamed protein product [Didymodactylos carnosus]CAF1456474.1 unnamed protein product [Didymodactylos carnosus]CAF3700164.1 unnamed protein product [Didymodactylos carnosus]CAF4328255.1 unnamed protein product [Didymodactylos carnosus]
MHNIGSWFSYFLSFLWILTLTLITIVKSFFSISKQSSNEVHRGRRIVVVGGGIAGCGAAYALHKAGFDVTIYETSEKLGGNAKTHKWNDGITTGLSVLAWPATYFRNYIHLLHELDIQTTTVKLPFMIRDNNQQHYYAHDMDNTELVKIFKNDLKRWDKIINMIRKYTNIYCNSELSMYHMSYFNVFNYIPLKLLCFLFNISDRFYSTIIVSVYSSSFLTTNLRYIPSSILPLIDDLISVQYNRTPTMDTWMMSTSDDVFQRMTKNIQVNTLTPVTSVYINENNSHIYINNDPKCYYDRIIFACDAESTLKALNKQTSLLLQTLLKNITYTDDDDISFIKGIVHSDANVLPEQYKSLLVSKYSNFIDVRYDHHYPIYHNTFILSSWVPAAKDHVNLKPMLVTYSSDQSILSSINPNLIEGTIYNRRAHPYLTLRNMLISMLLRFVQGKQRMYFCGSYCTPGNGHDLSLLSGFVVAHVIGAPYPFEINSSAKRDFLRLQRIMGLE